MCYLADHLRDFRRKLYVRYIQPNIGKPRKLKVVPKLYDGILQPKHWKRFVEWRLSPEFKVIIVHIVAFFVVLSLFLSLSIDINFYLCCQDVSKAAKQARAKAKYPHRLGRLGYSGLREKLVSPLSY